MKFRTRPQIVINPKPFIKMPSKYIEYILVYSAVLVGCLLLGALSRIFVINIGADEFTAKIVFWIVVLIGIIIYAILTFLIHGLFSTINLFFFPNKRRINQFNEKSSILKELNDIRAEQQQLNNKTEQEKKDIAIKYTQKEFAPYCSNEDLNLLCQYIIFYAENKPLQNIKPITTHGLSNLDFYHFGWNIWKHFSISKQEEISLLLKSIFAMHLKEVEVETIKSHLKDDELKGIIKICKKLPVYRN